MDLTEFNEIRPYNDEELPQIFEELIADPAFQKAVTGVIPNVPFELLAQKMRACKTKREFQEAFCYGILWKIAQEHTDSLTLDHSRIPDHNIAYTYMSNHRDIILDSGFLSILLIDEGMDTVEIAIGDNLLIYPWIKKLVRVNKSFIVQRALTMRQMLESSARMSRYMHHTISQKKQSIWIAQREGRAKDSNDRTQDSVLKMLAMGGEGDVQSLFVLGSSIWPKNSFLKTFASGTIIGMVYFAVGALVSKVLLESGRYYSGGVLESKETTLWIVIVAGIFFALVNWVLAYFRFKESEIINRM